MFLAEKISYAYPLQEIERRKLFSDLRCGSLFEYAVRVLGYSEAAAGRRIAAMRLMREIPEVAEKIESGALNLAKLCQAQTFFRGVQQAEPQQKLNTERKKEVLALIEEKTTRQTEKILLEMGGNKILPREQMKTVSAEHTEVRFLIDENLREKLAEVRSLLGPKGGRLGLAELMLEMATLAADRLAVLTADLDTVCSLIISSPLLLAVTLAWRILGCYAELAIFAAE